MDVQNHGEASSVPAAPQSGPIADGARAGANEIEIEDHVIKSMDESI